MKKTIFAIFMLASFSILTSCGGSTKDKKNDEEKKDSVVAEKKEIVKDYKYFEAISKELKLEGLELSSANKYSDSSSKSFSYGFYIKDTKEKGADKIIIKAGSVARLGNKSDVVTASLDDFKKVQTSAYKDNKGVTVSDFKEWKKDENVFYYFTIKGISDQMGGQKNYNQLFARYIFGDVYLDIIVNVYDNKAELTKAEQILTKAMEYIVK